MKKIFYVALGCILLGLGSGARGQNANDSYIEKIKLLKDMEGKPAPSFNVVTLSGRKVSLESLKGKTIVVNFWFVGCVPCQEEMPLLNKLTQDFHDKNVVFLAFSRSDKSATASFLSTHKFDYETVADAQNIAKRYNVSGFPSHFIIDNKGIVRYVSIGSSDDIGTMLTQELTGILDTAKKVNKVQGQKVIAKGSTVFRNEKNELVDTQEAVKMLGAGTYKAFRKNDDDGHEYYQLKPTNSQ